MSITRRRFLILSSATVSAIPLRSLLLAQAPHPNPETRFEAIRRNVGYFMGRGGTIGWLVDPEALVVVDTQFPDTAKLCLDGLKERSRRAIDVVINTHHHGDHTGGNGVFREAAKAILAHARVPELLKRQAAQNPEAPAPVLPTLTFDDSWSTETGDERVTAKHYGPAHTGGDAAIHFERAQIVHMGDLLFLERHPFIDRPAGASIQSWISTLERISTAMDRSTIFIAGHAKAGLPVTVEREALLRLRDYFDAALTHARRGITAGQSRDEITALESLKGFEEYQSAPPRLTLASTLGVAYDELTEK